MAAGVTRNGLVLPSNATAGAALRFVDSLPLTITGKVCKNVLREQVALARVNWMIGAAARPGAVASRRPNLGHSWICRRASSR
jgi:hypothetical protein